MMNPYHEIMQIVTMVISLVLGAPDANMSENRAALPSYGEAPLYCHLSLEEIRGLIQSNQGLSDLALEGRSPEQAFQESAMQLSSMFGINEEAIIEAFRGIRGVHFWLLGFGEDDDNLRPLIVIERSSNSEELLPLLLTPFQGEKQFLSYDYSGSKIYGFLSRRGEGAVMTECNGSVAIAMDPLTIERFILQSKNAVAGTSNQNLFELKSHTPTVLSYLMAILSRYEKDDFFLVSSLLEFSSIENASFTVESSGNVRLDIQVHESSPLNVILEGPTYPAQLLSGVSEETPFVLALALKDPREIWNHIVRKDSLFKALNRGRSLSEEMSRELSQLGLDLGKDIFGNILELGVKVDNIMGDPTESLRILIRVRDTDQASNTITAIAKAARFDNPEPRPEGAQKIWEIDGGSIVLEGDTITITPPRRGEATVSNAPTSNTHYDEHLRKVYSPATSFLHFNPSQAFPGGEVTPFSLGMYFQNNTLTIRSFYRPQELIDSSLQLMEQFNPDGEEAMPPTAYEKEYEEEYYEEDLVEEGYSEEEYGYEEEEVIEPMPPMEVPIEEDN